MPAPEGMSLSYFHFALETFYLLWEPSKLYDTTKSWKPVLGRGQYFLEIFDIPFSPKEPTRLVLKATGIDKDHVQRTLPTQAVHAVRVYFGENIDYDREKSLSKRTSFAGSPAMISQWGMPSKQIHWETHSYQLSLELTLKGGNAVWHGGGAEKVVKPPYIDSISIAAGIIQRRLRCMIVSTEDGRTICEYFPSI